MGDLHRSFVRQAKERITNWKNWLKDEHELDFAFPSAYCKTRKIFGNRTNLVWLSISLGDDSTTLDLLFDWLAENKEKCQRC